LNCCTSTSAGGSEVSRGEIEACEVYAVRAKPISFGDVVDVDTVGMVGVVTVIAEQENVFLICATTDDTSPVGFVVFFRFFGWDFFIVSHCLDFICDGIGT
jgi:hypothetical protein